LPTNVVSIDGSTSDALLKDASLRVTTMCEISQEREDLALLPDSRGSRRVALFHYIANRRLGPPDSSYSRSFFSPFSFNLAFSRHKFRAACVYAFYVSNRNIIIYLIISTESRCYLYLYIIFIYII